MKQLHEKIIQLFQIVVVIITYKGYNLNKYNFHIERIFSTMNKFELKDVYTVSEASCVWGINVETIKNKLKPSKTPQKKIDSMINRGLIKYYAKTDKERKEWIITKSAMQEWFGDPKK